MRKKSHHRVVKRNCPKTRRSQNEREAAFVVTGIGQPSPAQERPEQRDERDIGDHLVTRWHRIQSESCDRESEEHSDNSNTNTKGKRPTLPLCKTFQVEPLGLECGPTIGQAGGDERAS